MDRQTDRWTERQKQIQKNRYTDFQAEKQTQIQKHRQRNRHKYNKKDKETDTIQ